MNISKYKYSKSRITDSLNANRLIPLDINNSRGKKAKPKVRKLVPMATALADPILKAKMVGKW